MSKVNYDLFERVLLLASLI